MSLGKLESGAGDVTKALQKMGSSFDGSKTIKDAEIATKAVNEIGGATKLTAAEQQRLNAVLVEGIAKYEALGKQAPDDMVRLAKETQHTSGIMGDLVSQVKATALGFVSAQAIIGGIQTAFRALTEFVGSSIQSFANAEAASKKLSVALTQTGTATPSVIASMNDLAAEFQRTTVYGDDLITEMEALLTQVGNVAPSQMKKALQASTDLASGLGIDLEQATTLVAKAFAGGGDELGRLKAILGDTIGKGHDMADVLSAIERKFGGHAQGEIETYAGSVKQLANDWDNLKEVIGQRITQDPVVIAAMRLATEQIRAQTTSLQENRSSLLDAESSLGLLGVAYHYIAQQAKNANTEVSNFNAAQRKAPDVNTSVRPALDSGIFNNFGKDLIDVNRYLKEWEQNNKDAKEALKQHQQAVKDLADAQKPLTQAQQDAVIAAKLHGDSLDKVANVLGRSVDAVNAYIKSVEDAKKADSAWIELKQKLAASGLATAQSLAKREEDIAHIRTDANNKALADLVKFSEKNKQAQLSDTDATIRAIRLQADGILDVYRRTLGESSVLFQNLSDEIEQDVSNQIFNTLDKAATAAESLRKPVKNGTLDFGELSQALAQLAQVSGGAFGGMVSSLSTLVVSANAANKAIDLMRTTGEAKSKLEGILDMATGITGIVSAAVAAGKAVAALFGLFDRNKGRDLVVDFAETFGGFDALHEKLLTLGDAGEALWIKLTQGVGRNNPQQAQQVIDEVTKALDEQAAKSGDVTDATEEQAQATIETASQAAKALEELGPKLEDNKAQWKDWGAVVTAQLQAIADTIRSIPIPNPSGTVPFSAGGGTTKVQVNSPVYLDGRQITENVAYHTLN